MKVISLSLFSLLLAFSATLMAQGTPVPATDDTETLETTDLTIEDLNKKDAKMDKKDKTTEGGTKGSMLEFGIRPAYMWVAGDVAPDAGFGVGVHFRKALDHLFSLRVQGLYGNNSGMNENNSRQFESQWISGSGAIMMTLNNFRFNGDTRKTNFYVLLGAGGHLNEVERQRTDAPWDDNGTRNITTDADLTVHALAGAGITFRLSPRINIGAEFNSYVPFGKRADALDGYSVGSNFRDIQNVAALSLNFNLGNASTKSEPLYWTNAFTPVRDELDRVSGKIDSATKDSDGDGVVDAVDQEANTPAGVPVDTRGKTLDSDKDGVPDYKDLEPFFPPRAGETVDANGVISNRNDKPITEDRVQEMIDLSIARAKAADNNQAGTTTVRTINGGDIYLPMIYFPLGQSTVKYSDYGTLSSVARVLQGNPGMRMVIRGYTDRVGNAASNEVLSYRRAKAVVDHLVDQHGINRSDLILQFRGEENAIVPLDNSYINRRVEFLNAPADASEDAAPAGANGRGGF
jgi:outer membrane protein OmpA-like peptidoglycan-associated protein